MPNDNIKINIIIYACNCLFLCHSMPWLQSNRVRCPQEVFDAQNPGFCSFHICPILNYAISFIVSYSRQSSQSQRQAYCHQSSVYCLVRALLQLRLASTPKTLVVSSRRALSHCTFFSFHTKKNCQYIQQTLPKQKYILYIDR